MKTKLIFYGSTKLAAYILGQIVASDQYDVRAVITQPDRPVGRKKVVTPTAVGEIASRLQILTLKPEKLDASFVEENRTNFESDLGIVAAYGKLIPKSLLDIPKFGNLNVHPSLLPKYRGPSPIISAILSGEKTSGVTIMVVDEQMDHGDILAMQDIVIPTDETAESLEDKMAKIGADLLLKVIPDFLNKTISSTPQDHSQATYTKIISKDDGYFDISAPPPSEELDRMIHAFYPWPNVWTRFKGKIVKFYPGGFIQMEGKNKIRSEDFYRGYPDFPYLF